MKFSEIKDDNGTHLQTFAEMLMAKAKDAGLIAVMVFVGKSGANKGIHAFSSMDGSAAHALITVGKAMLADAPIEQQLLAPVSPGKAN